MEIIEGPVLNDNDMRDLLCEVSRKREDTKVLQDAIRRLARNRVHIMRQLKQIEAVVSMYQASVAMSQSSEHETSSLKKWINRTIFGVKEPAIEHESDAVKHLNRLQKGMAAVRDAAKRQRVLRTRLEVTRSVLQRYEAQIERLKRERVPMEEVESMVRRETAQIRRLLSEARTAENNAVQTAEALRVELRVVRRALEDARRSLSQVEAERDALRAENERLKHDLNLSEVEVERLREANDRQEIAQQQVMEELDRVRYELDEKRLETRRLQGEIDVLQAHREQLIRSIEANVSEKRRVRGMLRDALEELHQLRRAHPKAEVVALPGGKEPALLPRDEAVDDGAGEGPCRMAW